MDEERPEETAEPGADNGEGDGAESFVLPDGPASKIRNHQQQMNQHQTSIQELVETVCDLKGIPYDENTGLRSLPDGRLMVEHGPNRRNQQAQQMVDVKDEEESDD